MSEDGFHIPQSGATNMNQRFERVERSIRKAMRKHRQNNPNATREAIKQAGLQAARNEGLDIDEISAIVEKIIALIEAILEIWFAE